MIEVEPILAYAAENEERFVADLKELLRIPSVSRRREGVEKCVNWLNEHLQNLGMATEVFETGGNPIIIAEMQGKSDKTLLFYGHYDVQPEDPIEKWDHPPFAAEEIDGRIYARGAVDAKGNFFCIIKALESHLKTHGRLPCNVKMILEGEEEVGSPSLEPFIAEHGDLLEADAMVWFDGGIHVDGRAEVCLGMKGMLYVELSVETNDGNDLHSGRAPIVDNAAWRLVWALNSLFTPEGKVAIEGFYDDVLPPSETDRRLMKESKLSEEDLLEKWEIPKLRRNLQYTDEANLLEKLFFEPTCTICGITTGYAGPGSKTVIPARASAKVDLRLVPTQEPGDILEKLRRHLDKHGFCDVEIEVHSSGRASKSSSDAPIVDLVIDIMKTRYGRPVVKPIVEGSGPGGAIELIGVPYVFSRLGPPEDRSHAPNEYTTREAYKKGIATVIEILAKYGQEV